MAHIFISYAREDQQTAKGLADLLDSEGFDVWWDTEIYIGQSFVDLIEQAIDDCRQVIVLWSPCSLKSEWVMREAQRAHRQRKLLPVALGNFSYDDLPDEFRTVHTIAFEGWGPLLRELQRATGASGHRWESHTLHRIVERNPPVLSIRSPDLMPIRLRLEPGTEINARVLGGAGVGMGRVIGRVEGSFDDTQHLVLRNLSARSWRARLPPSEFREVAARETVILSPGLVIDFGRIEAIVEKETS